VSREEAEKRQAHQDTVELEKMKEQKAECDYFDKRLSIIK
jgi:hypothetical protein